jgi:crossover junction endodeoxyribonuclease RuvC
MRVLAIDASLRNTGVAVVETNGSKMRALYFGVIHNASSLRSSDCCALESVIYVQSHKTAISLGAARGAAILAAAENGLPIFEYAPTRIKQAAVGRGGAAKNQVAFMVRASLGLTETPGADEADALAIGMTHLRSQEAARLGVPGGAQI